MDKSWLTADGALRTLPHNIHAMLAVFLPCIAVFGALCLYHVNRAMCVVPKEAHDLSPRRWTVNEIKAGYKKAVHAPVDVTESIPPKQNRRYIVVGGSGLVGNWIISHLVSRGESPAAIRILDLHLPRRELLDLGITFVKTDITGEAAVLDAFSQPWPPPVAKLPLTVFHNAAVIRPAERHIAFLPLCCKVNVSGTMNVLNAAKKVGASCFISTSSGSVCLRRASYWIAPWTKTPKHSVQIINDSTELPKEHHQFFGNYAVSKVEAEGIVRAADDLVSNFRTGCIRPANGIYGIGDETSTTVTGMYLRLGGAATETLTHQTLSWLSPTIQNFVNAENVSIAHLLYEQRLIEHTNNPSTLPNIGGQAFVVTDPNPAITFGDIYLLLTTLATTPIRFPEVSPLPMLILSHLVEWYILLQHLYLPRLPKATGEMAQLQPALFSISNPHIIIDDSRARKSPGEGGLGYAPPLTSLDGMCKEVENWNRLAAERGAAAMLGKGLRTYKN
ncbi:hypothetical protein BDW59DRAFT_162272 [Aspergillus cavernicola]|uniref:3-beta hydroxysteroid dehydrogenase/isomerase domain-containing protein n=1 Tax=Aspergillus cavernicola TaxID=176166 RepID=A0ABR4IA74_9EURO